MTQSRSIPNVSFIPCTREITIGDDVVYRPTRMWHSGTFAGEGHRHIPSTTGNRDRSGCLNDEGMCSPPKSVTTRLYWNVNRPDDSVSAILSYPGGMGLVDEYFWEALGTRADGDIERWTGPDAEKHMEDAIRVALGTSFRGTLAAREAKRAREERPSKLEQARKTLRDAAAALRGEQDDTDPFDLN